MARVDREFFTEEDIKKNRIEDILESDEEVLVSLTPDKRDYILEAIFKSLPIVLIWLGFDVFFIIMMINTNAFENKMVIWFTVFFFAFHLLPVWLYFANIFKRVAGYKNIQYYIYLSITLFKYYKYSILLYKNNKDFVRVKLTL